MSISAAREKADSAGRVNHMASRCEIKKVFNNSGRRLSFQNRKYGRSDGWLELDVTLSSDFPVTRRK
jgi:hypothetical protein